MMVLESYYTFNTVCSEDFWMLFLSHWIFNFREFTVSLWCNRGTDISHYFILFDTRTKIKEQSQISLCWWIPLKEAASYKVIALSILASTPLPSRYVLAKLNWACEWPLLTALKYQLNASVSLCSTPIPLSYLISRLNWASTWPLFAANKHHLTACSCDAWSISWLVFNSPI